MSINRLLAALCLLALGAASTATQAWAQPIRIGVLTDESGNFAALSGAGSVLAAKMAVADFGGSVLGRPIEIIDADHKNRTDLGVQIAREWYDSGVIAIADVVNSAIALGVQDLARQKQRFALMSGPGTVDITGPRCNPYTYLWTWDTYADATVPVHSIVSSGGSKWFFLAADFAFGAAMQRDATAALTQAGGFVVGSVKAPLGETDFSSYMLQAQSSGANVLALANGGVDLINSIKQAAEFGLTSSQRVVALALNITDVHSLGLDKAQGILVTEGFYWDHDDATRAWSKRFFAEQHAMPAQSQAGTYSAVLQFLKAVKAANTTDPDAVAAEMHKLPVDDMFAHGGHLRADGRMVHDMYLMQVKTPAESKYPWDYYKTLATVPRRRGVPPGGGRRLPAQRKMSWLQRLRPLLAQGRKLARASAFDFGGMIVFYVLLYTVGLKAAIAGTIVFLVADVVRHKIAKLGFPKIYILSSAMALGFGLVDLLAKTPFMIKYEAVITSLVLAGMFAFGARGKSMIQEMAEQQQGEALTDRPDIRRFFQLMTLMWASYFLVKAIVYAWIGAVLPIEQTMRIRPVIGTASLLVMVAISTQAQRLFSLGKRVGLLPA